MKKSDTSRPKKFSVYGKTCIFKIFRNITVLVRKKFEQILIFLIQQDLSVGLSKFVCRVKKSL